MKELKRNGIEPSRRGIWTVRGLRGEKEKKKALFILFPPPPPNSFIPSLSYFLVIDRVGLDEHLHELVVVDHAVAADGDILQQGVNLVRGEGVAEGCQGLAELSLVDLASAVLVARTEAVQHVLLQLLGRADVAVRAVQVLELVQRHKVLAAVQNLLHLLLCRRLADSTKNVGHNILGHLAVTVCKCF